MACCFTLIDGRLLSTNHEIYQIKHEPFSFFFVYSDGNINPTHVNLGNQNHNKSKEFFFI